MSTYIHAYGDTQDYIQAGREAYRLTDWLADWVTD